MLRTHKRLALVLGARHPLALSVGAAVVGGSLLAAWSVSRIAINGVSPILAFRSLTLANAPAATASVTTTFDINAVLKRVPASAPVQNAGVIGCTYILTDGHRCD